MIRILTAVLATAGLAVAAPAAAQQTQSIAAIVNDDIVSVFDLKARLQMVIVSSGLEATPKVRDRLAPQVLRGLIDERIRIQEAKRRNVSVTKSNMKRAISSIEKRNKVKPGNLDKFLTKNGIPKNTLFSQLRAQIAWSKLVNRRLRPRVSISAEEVKETLGRIRARRGQTEYHIAEIFLAMDSPEQEAEVRRGANRLIEQIRLGAQFSAVARQFSQTSSAASGGDIGWFHGPDLDEDLKQAVEKLQPGEISDPIFGHSGFRIVKLFAKRRIGNENPQDTTVELRQVFLPLPPKPADKEVRKQMRAASILAPTIKGCSDIQRAAKEVKSPSSVDLGTFKESDLSPQIRAAVSSLAIGTASAPVRTRTGVLILMVCQRDQPELRLPSEKDIERQLAEQRLSRMARRYMRDLRNAAVVDMRL